MGVFLVMGIVTVVLIALITAMYVYYSVLQRRLDREEDIIKKDHLVRLSGRTKAIRVEKI
jgi:Na+-transporting methylmalonyl-CoA/oxaloacetate decarboxylase gamma subunit